ncbi:Zinc finger CCCH domain-containing protein 7 [Gryllus bimaculatus]|nr:Zinc finger CCCH domain-containing protein 7 [Gryllus bimaculatus]
MDEKDLLKEITFLTRLIGQHKNGLSRSVASTYHSQKTVNMSLQRSHRRVPIPNLKTSYSKVNRTQSQSTPKICVEPPATIVKIEPKVQVQMSTAPRNLQVIHVDKVKHKEHSLPETLKVAGNVKSVHINPNFFTNVKSNQREIGSLRCKSVHINPRLLDKVANNATTDYKKILRKCPEIMTNEHLESTSQSEREQCVPLIEPSISKLQPTEVTPKVSSEKVTNISVPIRTPTSRKKYVYRSKTKLVKALVNSTVTCKPSRKAVTPTNIQGVTKTIKTPHGGTLLAVSRTKLVRLPGKTRRSSSSKSDTTSTSQTVTKSRYRLRRMSASSQSSPLIRTARKVCSKYKSTAIMTVLGVNSKYHLDRRTAKTIRKGKPSSGRSQYKVDHRTSTPPKLSRVHSHLLLSPLRKSPFCNRTWTCAGTPRATQKVAISHKKLSRIGCNPGSRNSLQNSALVRIGGLLYKSSRNKLILSRSSEKNVCSSLKPRTIVKRQSLSAGLTVYMRGNKFVLDKCGKTLKRVVDSGMSSPSSPERKKSRVSRVDIGGVTYIQKTPTVLVRTNTHTARNVLSNAKQRSIAFLAQKMRKINTPCLFYRRFGRCPRLEKGRCELVHDPKYIDICRKFLQGKCTLDGCLLSHDVGPEKMPTCRFFLEGCCVRDLCPYLHVKVNDRAPICRNFLQGYCADGPECLKRHIMLCPEFDKKGSCAKGKYCPYPHSIAPRVQRAICSEPPITFSEHSEEQSNSPAPLKRKRYYEAESDELGEDQISSFNLKRKRYYETKTVSKGSHGTQSNVDTSANDIEQSTTECPGSVGMSRRPKIGSLPSFIALESCESDQID